MMRNLIVSMMVSADGFMQSSAKEGGWFVWDDEMEKYNSEWKRQITETYKALHNFAHPTAMGVLPLVADGGLFLGGRITEARIEDYRKILAGCAQMARNIEVAVPRSEPKF